MGLFELLIRGIRFIDSVNRAGQGINCIGRVYLMGLVKLAR